MLTVSGECRYTLLALSHLLASFSPEIRSFHLPVKLNSEEQIPPLLVVSGRATFYELYTEFRSAQCCGVPSTMLLGSQSQGNFLSRCGMAPDVVLSPDTSVIQIKQRVSTWLRASPPFTSIERTARLTRREQTVICASLKGEVVSKVCQREGFSTKTFYKHRSNALKKLGVRSIRQLLMNISMDTGNILSACIPPWFFLTTQYRTPSGLNDR